MYKTQLAWQWMSSQESFTAAEVANAVGMEKAQCQNLLYRLAKQGFIRHIAGTGKPKSAKRYAINKNEQPQVGRKGGARKSRHGKTGQQLIWNTLRINRRVTVNTVVAVTGCNDRSIYNYLLQLERAGYLQAVRVDKRLSSADRVGLESLWRLNHQAEHHPGDTGPKAPILRRGRGMFDQNRQQFYPFGPAPSTRKNAVQGATRSDGRLSDSHLQEPTPCNG